MNNFINDLNDFEDTAVCELNKNFNKKIFIKSNKFTGKTTISKKLFLKCSNDVVIYHSGCNPKYFDKSFIEFKKIVDNYHGNNITIILDEYYNLELLEYINKLKNITCYIFTNDKSLKHEDFINFNYYVFYEKFINNIFYKYLNINEILNLNILDKLENKRTCSLNTMMIVRYMSEEKVYNMEFK